MDAGPAKLARVLGGGAAPGPPSIEVAAVGTNTPADPALTARSDQGTSTSSRGRGRGGAPGRDLSASRAPAKSVAPTDRSFREGGMSLRSQSAKSLTTFGDHTVESEHIMPPIFTKADARPYDSHPFFEMSNGLVRRGDARVQYVAADHGVVFDTPLIRQSSAGGIVAEAHVRMVIGGYEPHVRYTIRHDVLHVTSVCTGAVDKSAFDPYLLNGQVTDKAIGSVLMAIFTQVAVARGLCGWVLNGLERYDNTALYMKGAFYALLRARCDQEVIDVGYTPFPADTPVVHIDINDQVGDAIQSIGQQIMAGAFTFMVGWDFDVRDLDIVYWLAAGGRRIRPGAAVSIAAMAIHFPAIPFCILRKGGAAPAVPVPAAISPARVWDFIRKMSINRTERDYFVSGVYESAFLVNGTLWRAQNGLVVADDVRARPDTGASGNLIAIRNLADIPEAAREHEWYCYTSASMETLGEVQFPTPREYNILQRYLGIKRTEEVKFLNDYVSFGHTSMVEKLLHCAILSGFFATCVTTVLQTTNVYGSVLQRVCRNADDTPPLFRMVMDDYSYLRNPTGTKQTTAMLFISSLAVLDRHIGGTLPLSCMAYRNWNLPINQWAFIDGPFNIEFPHHPPRLGNPLSIMAWMDAVPAEWGIIDSLAKVDLRHDTRVQGPAAIRGWLGVCGSREYQDQRTGGTPYTIIPYGALCMNAISQALVHVLPPGEPRWRWQQLAWDNSGGSPMTQVDQHPHPPHWLGPAHRIYEPCTIMTYDWDEGMIYAPALYEAQTNTNTLYTLANTPLGPETSRGYVLCIRVTNGQNLQFAPPPFLQRAVVGAQTAQQPLPGVSTIPPSAQAEFPPAANAPAPIPSAPSGREN